MVSAIRLQYMWMCVLQNNLQLWLETYTVDTFWVSVQKQYERRMHNNTDLV